jgi:hypothetical protein
MRHLFPPTLRASSGFRSRAVRAGSGACGGGIRTRVSGGFRGTARSRFVLSCRGTGSGDSLRATHTASSPETAARRALRPGGRNPDFDVGLALLATGGDIRCDPGLQHAGREVRNRRTWGAGKPALFMKLQVSATRRSRVPSLLNRAPRRNKDGARLRDKRASRCLVASRRAFNFGHAATRQRTSHRERRDLRANVG